MATFLESILEYESVRAPRDWVYCSSTGYGSMYCNTRIVTRMYSVCLGDQVVASDLRGHEKPVLHEEVGDPVAHHWEEGHQVLRCLRVRIRIT